VLALDLLGGEVAAQDRRGRLGGDPLDLGSSTASAAIVPAAGVGEPRSAAGDSWRGRRACRAKNAMNRRARGSTSSERSLSGGTVTSTTLRR
jgi:hypothetical protein